MNRKQIQANLALAEVSLVPAAELAARKARLCPLLFAASGFIFGILLSGAAVLPAAVFLLLFSALLALAAFLRKKGAGFCWFAAVLFIASSLLGMQRAASFRNFPPDHINSLISKRTLAQVEAEFVNNPRINERGDFAFCTVNLLAVESAGRDFMAVKGRSNCYISIVSGKDKLPEAGDKAFMYAVFKPISKAKNPGQFDYAAYLRTKGIQTSLNVRSDGIEILERGRPSLFDSLERIAVRTVRGPEESPSSGLLSALLIGRRENLSDETYQNFRTTGLMHLLSLSGMHIGILAGIVWLLLSLTELGTRGKSLITAAFLILYMIVIPYRSPAMRATLICLLYLSAIAFGRRANALNMLSLACLVTLGLRPLELYSAGWQLSFISVFSIIVFTKPCNLLLNKLTGFRFAGASIEMPGGKRIASWLIKAFSVGLAVFAGTAPVIWQHFYAVYPYSTLNTILLSPLLTLNLAFGLISAVVSAVLPALDFTLEISRQITGVFAEIVRRLSLLPGSELALARPPSYALLAYYPAIGLAAFSLYRAGRKWKLAAGVAGLIAAGLFLFPLAERAFERPLKMTVLSVGAGQAIVLEMPGGETAMLDCGSSTYSRPGKKIIQPFLKQQGIDSLEFISLSHDDSDHYSGVDYLAGNLEVGRIYSADIISCKSPLETAPEAYQSGGCRILFWQNKAADEDNNRSLVQIIQYAGKTTAVTADVQQESQHWLLKRLEDEGISPDFLILPHHGLLTTLDLSFPEKLSPEACVASCGELQDFRGVYESDDFPVYKTAQAGAVQIKITRSGKTQIETFLK
ncbi:ComEC/Rec2 family competence protein [Sedimentisphaera salicampi]|uniref:ComEC/Rec2 family competence protein n=1 Tax=Sedimentisphaera salicampi TaxID=1941349 RepID=UPI000B9B3A5B|nr:ComEC/Rec2 family competence protein [Sedimentisphaera salicampi]OXU14444.1 ComEC family competence protein [Sedimentisphaera salicampi]